MHQDRRLIPVDVLGAHLALGEADSDDQRHSHLAPGRRDAREEDRDLAGVGETDDDLVDESLGTDGAGERTDLEVVGNVPMKNRS